MTSAAAGLAAALAFSCSTKSRAADWALDWRLRTTWSFVRTASCLSSCLKVETVAGERSFDRSSDSLARARTTSRSSSPRLGSLMDITLTCLKPDSSRQRLGGSEAHPPVADRCCLATVHPQRWHVQPPDGRRQHHVDCRPPPPFQTYLQPHVPS